MSASDHLQGQLFDVPEPEAPSDISSWAQRNWWHASKKGTVPQDNNTPNLGFGLGFHVGTAHAAVDRTDGVFEGRILHPVELHGDFSTIPAKYKHDIAADKGRGDAVVWKDWPANTDPRATNIIKSGKNIAYVNEKENTGSISVRAPRSNLRTWAETVVASPENFSAVERKAARDGWTPAYNRTGAFSQRDKNRFGVTDKAPGGLGPLDTITVHGNTDTPVTLHGVWTRPYDPKYVKENSGSGQGYLPGLDPDDAIREGLKKTKARIGLPQPIGSSFK